MIMMTRSNDTLKGHAEESLGTVVGAGGGRLGQPESEDTIGFCPPPSGATAIQND